MFDAQHISYSLGNLRPKKYFETIYPSRRHNLPHTLEIIIRNFPKKSKIFKISKIFQSLVIYTITLPNKFSKSRLSDPFFGQYLVITELGNQIL